MKKKHPNIFNKCLHSGTHGHRGQDGMSILMNWHDAIQKQLKTTHYSVKQCSGKCLQNIQEEEQVHGESSGPGRNIRNSSYVIRKEGIHDISLGLVNMKLNEVYFLRLWNNMIRHPCSDTGVGRRGPGACPSCYNSTWTHASHQKCSNLSTSFTSTPGLLLMYSCYPWRRLGLSSWVPALVEWTRIWSKRMKTAWSF